MKNKNKRVIQSVDGEPSMVAAKEAKASKVGENTHFDYDSAYVFHESPPELKSDEKTATPTIKKSRKFKK